MLEEGRASYRGCEGRLEWAGRRIPIIVSAHGPQSVRLAGRVGDGVVIGLGVTPDVVRGSLELLAEGAWEAGRSPDELDVWFTCFWFVEEEPGDALEQSAWAATAFALHFARWGVDGRFVPDEYRDGVVELGKAYDLTTTVPCRRTSRPRTPASPGTWAWPTPAATARLRGNAGRGGGAAPAGDGRRGEELRRGDRHGAARAS